MSPEFFIMCLLIASCVFGLFYCLFMDKLASWKIGNCPWVIKADKEIKDIKKKWGIEE